MTDREKESPLPRVGWILYDGGCGFCFRWVHFWEKVVETRGFAIKDLQSASADGSLRIADQNLLDDIRVLTRDRKLESGANAYLYVARRIWWAWPFYAIFSLPVFNWILWRSTNGLIGIGIESRATVRCPRAQSAQSESP